MNLLDANILFIKIKYSLIINYIKIVLQRKILVPLFVNQAVKKIYITN